MANREDGFSQLFFMLDIVEDILSGVLIQELIMEIISFALVLVVENLIRIWDSPLLQNEPSLKVKVFGFGFLFHM